MDHHQQNASTFIVIVNWRNPWDTIECLESVLSLDCEDWAVIVCDNDSQDGSIEVFRAWSEGRLCINTHPSSPMYPGRETPGHARASDFFFAKAGAGRQTYPAKSIAFIENHANSGFAGGNNVGLRIAMEQPRANWVWLLNNDTVVHPASLRCQIERSQRHGREHMIGVTIMEYYMPTQVQYNAGASYNDFTTIVKPIRQVIPDGAAVPEFESSIEKKMSYVSGASMFLPMSTLKMLGLMDERYFLYYEELDWIANHRSKIDLLYATNAVIHHKEGGTTGGKTVQKIKSKTSEYYSARSRLMYTLKHRPAALLTVIPIQIFAFLKRLFKDHKSENASIVLRASIDAIKMHQTT